MATSLERDAWSPYVVYRWTTDELQAWIAAHGTSRHYDGRRWTPRVSLADVGEGLNDVRFEPCD